MKLRDEARGASDTESLAPTMSSPPESDDEAPDSMRELRPRASTPAEDEVTPDDLVLQTLIARSPFDDAEVPLTHADTAPAPFPVAMPAGVVEPMMRAAREDMPTRIQAMAAPPPASTTLTAPGVVANAPARAADPPYHKLYVTLAFAAGLLGGLVLIAVIYALLTT